MVLLLGHRWGYVLKLFDIDKELYSAPSLSAMPSYLGFKKNFHS